MEYVSEVFNRRTGELETVSQGDWITITELGQFYGVGERRVRTVLRHLDVLAPEGDGRHQRHRLTAWFVESGYGRRIERKNRIPFDVVGPDGRDWIGSRWSAALAEVEDRTSSGQAAEAKKALAAFNATRREELRTQEAICWLCDHFPDLSQGTMAAILDVTQQLVSRFVRVRRRQLEKAREGIDKALQ